MEVKIGSKVPIRLINRIAGKRTTSVKMIETIGINTHDSNDRGSRIDSTDTDWVEVALAINW